MGKIVVAILSVGYVLVISAVGSLVGLIWGLGWGNYFASFCIITAVQLFLGKLWNYFVDRKIRLRMEQVRAANALAEAVQNVQLDCAYCGTTNIAQIYVGEKNTFNCQACEQPNSVLIETSCVRTTTPVMPKADLAAIFRGIDEKTGE